MFFPVGENTESLFFLFNILGGVKDFMLSSDVSVRLGCDDRGHKVLLDSKMPLATSKSVLVNFISASSL